MLGSEARPDPVVPVRTNKHSAGETLSVGKLFVSRLDAVTQWPPAVQRHTRLGLAT